MSIEIVSATHIPFHTLTNLLNAAYRDYIVPMQMDIEEFRSRVVQDDILLEGSRIAVNGTTPVALGLLAKRGRFGWVGGVGVVSNHRRHGIGRDLMHALIQSAREHDVARVQLEVISTNDPAKALYDDLGFETHRMLYIINGQPTVNVRPFTIQQVQPAEALAFYDRFHTVTNPWQRQREALEMLLPQLTAHVAIDKAGVQAYVLGVFHARAIRLVDLGHQMPEAMRALIGYLHRQHPLAVGSMINISEDDPAWPVLFALGYKPVLSQHEMHLILD